MNRLVHHGSYILITPIELEDGVCKGKIYSNVMKHQLNIDQIVYYLERDTTLINFKGKELHVILHYHIFFKEIKVKEKKKGKNLMDIEFKGLTL